MSRKDPAQRCRTRDTANQPVAVSRRQVLTSGAAVAAIVTLPTLAGESRASVGPEDEGAPRAQLTDEKRRLAAVLDRYGPELGSGR